MAWLAASAASAGKPYPQIAAVPASSRHSSTRGSFSASSRRRRAASGSALRTARPIAARICPGVFPVTASGDDGGFGFRRGGVAQHPGGLGDQLRFVLADDPFGERLPGQREAGGQVVGQRDHPFRGPPGQRERGGGLIGAERVPPGRFPAPGGRLPAGGRGAAGGQFRDRGQPPGRRPRLRFRPPGQHPDQLVVIEVGAAVRAGGGGVQRLRQRRARQAGVERVPGGEPRPGPALLARHRIPRQEPRVQARIQARCRARIH